MKQDLPGKKQIRDLAPTETRVRNALRREFSVFFTAMLTPEKNWPAISDEDFVDALVDSIVQTAANHRRGLSMAQTLAFDLQEEVNHRTASA